MACAHILASCSPTLCNTDRATMMFGRANLPYTAICTCLIKKNLWSGYKVLTKKRTQVQGRMPVHISRFTICTSCCFTVFEHSRRCGMGLVYICPCSSFRRPRGGRQCESHSSEQVPVIPSVLINSFDIRLAAGSNTKMFLECKVSGSACT